MAAPRDPGPPSTDDPPPDDAITFAEQMLQLLEEASFSTTYKHAVLLALMDACLGLADGAGRAPAILEVGDLAERVIALYWPHVVPYPPAGSAEPLSQSGTGQAEIVSLVRRARAGGHGTARTLAEARSAPTWDRLVDDVAWKLAEMPLPRLQRVGTTTRPFIYDIAWNDQVTRRVWRSGTIDTRVRLQPRVGDHLIRLVGLLRPLVQRRWVERVCRLNPQVTDTTGILESFLFGADRLGAVRLRVALLDLQDGRCFYTGTRIAKAADAQVDHFLPWARHPSDAIENLVVASTAANAAKLAHLAAPTMSPTGVSGSTSRPIYWQPSPQQTAGPPSQPRRSASRALSTSASKTACPCGSQARPSSPPTPTSSARPWPPDRGRAARAWPRPAQADGALPSARRVPVSRLLAEAGSGSPELCSCGRTRASRETG